MTDEQQVKADKAAQDISVPTIKRILVPVDKAPLSMKAANYAIHLAELEKAKELIVMHVVEDIKQGGAIGLRARPLIPDGVTTLSICVIIAFILLTTIGDRHLRTRPDFSNKNTYNNMLTTL